MTDGLAKRGLSGRKDKREAEPNSSNPMPMTKLKPHEREDDLERDEVDVLSRPRVLLPDRSENA
jgi:hypothetical protein